MPSAAKQLDPGIGKRKRICKGESKLFKRSEAIRADPSLTRRRTKRCPIKRAIRRPIRYVHWILQGLRSVGTSRYANGFFRVRLVLHQQKSDKDCCLSDTVDQLLNPVRVRISAVQLDGEHTHQNHACNPDQEKDDRRKT